MATTQPYFCEVCGAPGICFVRDVVRTIAPTLDGSVTFEPDGPPHCFCAEHDRKSCVREEFELPRYEPWQ